MVPLPKEESEEEDKTLKQLIQYELFFLSCIVMNKRKLLDYTSLLLLFPIAEKRNQRFTNSSFNNKVVSKQKNLVQPIN